MVQKIIIFKILNIKYFIKIENIEVLEILLIVNHYETCYE